ncbi:hypothetical protein VSDG_01686 [Cytospora chrysosperma]|uniref:DNA-directed RNA polymerase III subunit RPC4 n=1 Tax=Cytospora chrysosperma TaxID=252740 RepID=A0A423WH65_CYTCH|nr:hypothetical protein VSDG_01686 [Valsa sordida]
MAPEGPARGARGGVARGRGAPRRARGGRGGAATAAPRSDNNAPEAEMGDATAAAPAAPIHTQTNTDAPSNPQPDSTPGPSTARPVVSRPTAARAGAAGAAKFLPRAVRRSQLDREAIAQKESQKQEDRAAQEARLRRGGRGRGGGRRARGGAPGGYQDRIIRGGAGGFASMIEATASRGSSSGFGRLYDYGSAGGSSGGGGGGSWGGGGGVKLEGGPSGFSTESSRPTGKRLNTDKIVEYVVIEDEEEQVKSKEGAAVLLPKGMQRDDPKEPDQPVIATAEEVEAADRGETIIPVSSGGSEADEADDDVFFNDADVEMRDDERQWPGAKPESRVKVEGEEVNEIDTLTMKKATKKAEQKAKKLKTKYKDPEDQLAAETLAFQRRLFGVESDEDSDSDAPREVKAPRKPAIIDGNLYMFQFPPVLPPLHVVERTQNPHNLVKDEPNDDMVMLDAPDHKPVDLTAADDFNTIKKEEGAANAARNPSQSGEAPSGFLGKLIIRKSGKMQIDYGGMIFDCESGIPVEFLRTAVLTEMDDEKKTDGYAGTAYGMGQIAGKFVSVPKWSDEEEWVVDPSELPPNGVGAAEDA